MIYFLKLKDTPFVKIGFTKNLKQRLKKLQSENPHEIILIGTIEGGRELENYYHSVFQKLHVRGEWFQEGNELIQFFEKKILTTPHNHGKINTTFSNKLLTETKHENSQIS